MKRDLTAANSIFNISAPSLNLNYNVGAFNADNIFEVSDTQLLETVMTADGSHLAGAIFEAMEFKVSIYPTHDSFEKTNLIVSRQKTLIAPIRLNLTITYKSIGKRAVMTDAYITHSPLIVGADKILKSVDFTFRVGEVTMEDI